MAKGLFVVFEGGEGTGKTTQIEAVKNRLVSEGHQVLVSFEPGGTPLGEKIRSLVLDPVHAPVHPRTEALLFAAARAQHVELVIRPALAQGKIVLCDRYWDASRAYQGVARGLGTGVVDQLNEFATQGLRPDWTFVFDIDPKEGLQRARSRNLKAGREAADRLEQEALSFHENLRQAYLHFARQESSRYRVIDARADVGSITPQLIQDIQQCLKQKA